MRYLLVLLLAGCGSWQKPGGTQNDFISDRGFCEAQADSVSRAGMIQRNSVMENCLIGKGWRYRSD